MKDLNKLKNQMPVKHSEIINKTTHKRENLSKDNQASKLKVITDLIKGLTDDFE